MRNEKEKISNLLECQNDNMQEKIKELKKSLGIFKIRSNY